MVMTKRMLCRAIILLMGGGKYSSKSRQFKASITYISQSRLTKDSMIHSNNRYLLTHLEATYYIINPPEEHHIS